jgi:hypothetical protein
MTPKKAQKVSREEMLRKKRLAEQIRRQQIRDNPDLKRIQQQKERERYQKKLAAGKVKLVASMSDREHRAKQKQWRVNLKKYYEKINREISHEGCSTYSSSSSRQETNIRIGKKVRKQNRDILIKKTKMLEKKIQDLNKKIDRLRKREERRVKNAFESSKVGTDVSPRTKATNILRVGDEKVIAKKVLFAETVSDGLAKGYRELKKEYDRRVVKHLLVKNQTMLKKYRLLNEFNVIASKLFSKSKLRTLAIGKDFRIRRVQNLVKSEIVQFFERDDSSRMCPGKKDYKTFKKVRMQKRYLLKSLKELHEQYCETSVYKVSYSLFCKLKPFWVVKPRASDRETCACQIHANIELLLSALNEVGAIEMKNTKDVTAYVCCDINSVACLQRTCQACKNSVIPYSHFAEDQPIVYKKWVRETANVTVKGKVKTVAHTKKIDVESTIVETLPNFETELFTYMHHKGVSKHTNSKFSLSSLTLKRFFLKK